MCCIHEKHTPLIPACLEKLRDNEGYLDPNCSLEPSQAHPRLSDSQLGQSLDLWVRVTIIVLNCWVLLWCVTGIIVVIIDWYSEEMLNYELLNAMTEVCMDSLEEKGEIFNLKYLDTWEQTQLLTCVSKVKTTLKTRYTDKHFEQK